MDNYTKRFIKTNSFTLSEDNFGQIDSYYDLSFGNDTHRTIISCHKEHLEELLVKIEDILKVAPCRSHHSHTKDHGCKRCMAKLDEDYIVFADFYFCKECYEKIREPDIRL